MKADLRLSFGGKSRQFKKQDEGLTDWLTIMEKVLTIMRVAIPFSLSSPPGTRLK